MFVREVLSLVVLLIISAVYSAPRADNLVLTLPDGKIKGATYVTSNYKIYYGFRGIPYATPPVGDLRLESPQPAQPWNNIRDATSDSNNCISFSSYLNQLEEESEDCLYINVYVPTLQKAEKLPVMFWIYGGGFTEGSSEKSLYGPDFLIEEDVIVVTFNYRSGPFGFISTGDSSLPGNLGLKDQVLALKWTNNNIKYFGGDPRNITIFGQSAGGASTGLHLVSKQSAGLFRAAILESGSALNYWAVDPDPKTTAYLIADAIPGGNYGNNTEALKAFLKSRSIEELVAAHNSLPEGIGLGTQVWPTLEEDSDDAFLTESPYELLANNNYNQVPIIIGICAEEFLFFLQNLDYAKTIASIYDLQQYRTIPPDLFSNSSDEAEVIQKIRDIYLQEGENFVSNLVGFANYYSDVFFTTGVIKQAELTAKRNNVYLYEFSYFGRPLTVPFIDGAEKASHAAELPFLFNMIGFSNTTDSEDLLTQKRMVKLWTNFAKYLNPTPEQSELFDDLIWPTFDNSNYSYLSINNTLEIRNNIKARSYNEWNNIYEIYGRKPFITF